MGATRLMAGVCQGYGQGRRRGVAEALRQAQLDLTRVPATAHPFNWAAFTLIGVGETADTNGGDSLRVGQQANGDRP